MDSIERIRAEPASGGKRPEDMSPQELHAVLWQVLTFRDSGATHTVAWAREFGADVICSGQEDREDDRWALFVWCSDRLLPTL